MENKVKLGSIIHGTMREEDLIPAFIAELEYYKVDCSRWNDEMEKVNSGELSESDSHERMGYLLNEDLFDALNELAPDFCYFGSHPGDGSDYGFWVDDDGIEQARFDNEILTVEDTSEVPEKHAGYVLYVNDHGNATLYHSTNGKLSEMWSIV